MMMNEISALPLFSQIMKNYPNQINFTCLEEQTSKAVPDKSCHSMSKYLVDRAFLHNVKSLLSESEIREIRNWFPRNIHGQCSRKVSCRS